MKYHDLLLAHGAFNKFEKRAKFYDEFLRKKNDSNWLFPELPNEEIDNLFIFIKRWDWHFRGSKILFKESYRDIHPNFMELNSESFYSIDLLLKKNVSNIKTVFNSMANCNYEGRHESTDASKIIHAINPKLFIMWDRKIRKGILGGENIQYADYYILFLQKMKAELHELISSVKAKSQYDDFESLEIIEELSGGKTIAKLIDEYNYMTFTMPTEYSAYQGDFHQDTLEKLLNEPLYKSIDLWKKQLFSDRYSHKGQFRYFNGLLDEARKRGMISPKEWRDYSSRWQKNPNDRDFLTVFFENKLHE